MDTNTLNVGYLKVMGFNDENIDFFKRNKLIGFPLSRLDEVAGDCESLFCMLRTRLSYKREFDDEGRLTMLSYGTDSVYRYEYDDNDKLIKKHRTSESNYTVDYTKEIENQPEEVFDDRGRVIIRRFKSGKTHHFKYDERGNVIASMVSNSHMLEGLRTAPKTPVANFIQETQRTFDDNNRILSEKTNSGMTIDRVRDGVGNITSVKMSGGNDENYSYIYSDKGQLLEVKTNCEVTLTIPEF